MPLIATRDSVSFPVADGKDKMANILDKNGKPFRSEALAEPQTSKLGWVTREWAEHPSRGLTPQKLNTILLRAEQGDLSAQADLGLDMEEKDGHIHAELSKRKRALLTLDWTINAPRNASAEEKKQADQIREWFTDMPNFEDLLLDCLDGIGHGFSAMEITWNNVEGYWLPKTVDHRPQRWFQTLPYDGNALRLRNGTVEGADLLPFGWIVHRHRAKSGYLTRAGLHRVLVWPYLFKNYSTRDLAEFLEIYGLPLRVGKYPSGSTEHEKATLLAAVAGIGHNAAGIIPEGMAIDFENAAQGHHDPFQAMIDWCERTQSKAILGGTLTSQADGKSSTNALGSVHNEVRHDLLVSDARQVEGTLTGDLIYPVCALNFNQVDARRLPQFRFDTRQFEDMVKYASALPKLVGVGMQIPVNWAQEKLNIPQPKDGEAVLKLARPEMVVPPDMRARPEKAAMRYQAVLTNKAGEIVTLDQDALDHATDQLSAAGLNDEMIKLLSPAIQAVRNGSTTEEVISGLLEAAPRMDEATLADLLARAIFVADVWGRLHA